MVKEIGGLTGNRTRVHGFAVRCVTTPPSGRAVDRSGEGGREAAALAESVAAGNDADRPRLARGLSRGLEAAGAFRAGSPPMDYTSARLNMVESQVRTNDVTDAAIQEAMRNIHRERFVMPARAALAYADRFVEYVPGRWIMPPRDVAKLLHALRPRPGERALAIAAPYAAAVMARMGLEVTALEDPAADAHARLALEGEGERDRRKPRDARRALGRDRDRRRAVRHAGRLASGPSPGRPPGRRAAARAGRQGGGLYSGERGHERAGDVRFPPALAAGIRAPAGVRLLSGGKALNKP